MAVADAPAIAAAPARRRRRLRLRLPGMVVALLLVAVTASGASYAAVTLTRDSGPILPVGEPRILSEADAAAVAELVGHPVYGAGGQAGALLEVTRGSRGETWVRYLTGGAPAGDRRAAFVTVGTYRQPAALDAARAAAAGAQSRSAGLPGGGLMMWSLGRPTSVYVAQPKSHLLVEVYSPDAEQARALARSGAVTPLR